MQGEEGGCLKCAPKKASLQWHKGPGNKLEARENQLEAAEYEQVWSLNSIMLAFLQSRIGVKKWVFLLTLN